MARPSIAKKTFAATPRYRNNKGQLIKQKTFNAGLTEGTIKYTPTTTTDKRSKKQYQLQELPKFGGGPKGGIQGKGKYKAETIILDGGKEIYLVYQTQEQRKEIIDRILANQISPKDNPRDDGTRLNRNDRSKLKSGRYAEGRQITGLRGVKGRYRSTIQEREYKDLVSFTKEEYKAELER